MTELKTLVKNLRDTQKLADTDVEAASWQSRPSLSIMKKEAEENLVKLKTEYGRRLRSNTLGIFMFGDAERVARFSALAAEEAGVVTINGGQLYEDLARQIEPSFGASREFGPTQLGILHNALNNLRKDLDIRTMAMPRLTDLSVTRNLNETVNYIRTLVQGVLGDDLLRVYLDQKINATAIEHQFAGNLFPVAVTGLQPEEVSTLVPLFTNSCSVEVGTSEDGEVNKEFVLNQLSNFRKKIQSKTN